GVGCRHQEPDGVVVDGLDLLDRAQRGPPGGAGLGIEDPLEGEDHVRCLELPAVVELDPGPEGERPDPGLLVAGPAGRQHGLGLELLVDASQVVVDILGDHVLVTLDRQRRIDRPGRAGPRHLEGPALARRLGPGGPGPEPGRAGRAGYEPQLEEPAARERGGPRGPTVLPSLPHRVGLLLAGLVRASQRGRPRAAWSRPRRPGASSVNTASRTSCTASGRSARGASSSYLAITSWSVSGFSGAPRA